MGTKFVPTLDKAMQELKESDREAILLRYFENRQFAEVGAKLGLNENAARMRVERALEKLRGIFAKRGITTATALASVISANAVQMAPANLAAILTTASIATAGTGTFTLVKIMTATKIKTRHQCDRRCRRGGGICASTTSPKKITRGKRIVDRSKSRNCKPTTKIFQIASCWLPASKSISDEQLNELLKLRGEVTGCVSNKILHLKPCNRKPADCRTRK